MRQKLDGLQHGPVQVGRLAPAPRVTHELEQAPGDLLAAIGFLLDEAEVVPEVADLRHRGGLAVPQTALERFGAPGDRRERIVQLVRDAGGEPARRRESLREEHPPLEPFRERDVLHQEDRVRAAIARRLDGRRGEPEDLRIAGDDHLFLDRADASAVERLAEEPLHERCPVTRQEAREWAAGVGLARQRAGPGAVDPHHVEVGVEHEHPERQRLQHHLDEPLLGVELAGPVGDHPLQLGIQAGMLQRDRRLVRERHQQLLLVRRELVDVAPQDADGPDRPLADAQRCREHRSEAGGAREVRIPIARVRPEIAALHRPSLLHGAPGDPLAPAKPNRRHHLRRHVEARHHDQLVRRRIERRDATGVDAEHAAHFLQDHPDRPADVEARGDRPARREKRACLARPPNALVGEAPLLDPQGHGARELGDHIEVHVVDGSMTCGRERDRPQHRAAGCQGDERHRTVAERGKHAEARLGRRVALEVVDPHPGAGGHDAREQRPLERHPRPAWRVRRKSRRRQVDDLELTALGVEQQHVDRVEPHELGRALGERGEHLVERVARREQPRDPVKHGRAQGQPLTIVPTVDGRPELMREARRHRRRRQARDSTE